MFFRATLWAMFGIVLSLVGPLQAQPSQKRMAANEQELRFWLENMLWYHRYSDAEMMQVTGLSEDQLRQKLGQFQISDATRPARPSGKLLVQAYPGGRHPRIGFLEGAIEPQRETKLSAFCPWDDSSYAVLDIPEAIWSNLGLIYLAHTHVDTFWTRQSITLEQKEWTRLADGSFELVRRLPNGIEFGVKAIPLNDHLRMKMWLTNHTDQPLTDLRVQNCVMLKQMAGFEEQTNANKLFQQGYAVASSPDQKKWIISGWDPWHRAWGNLKCPCLHSDPKFADCPPGETQWLRGWFSFYAGEDIQSELARIEATGWRQHPLHHVTGNFVGKVVDASTNKSLPCRVTIRSADQTSWYFVRSTAVAGTAVKYDKQLGKTRSIEKHTTVSADGFQADLPAGRYLVRVEHGKEYLPEEKWVDIGTERTNLEFRLTRIADMASRGWYSGDTHVHRTLEELPNTMLAEDLNVALPLTYWVRDSDDSPADRAVEIDATPHEIDSRHVYYPINTEYEIFSIHGQRHTQGAVFVLNHRQPLTLTAPPVGPIAEECRRQGGLLDLDKHSWNWSLMIVPQMNVDLFELSNNHHWKTYFGFNKWTLENAPPAWPEIETNAEGFTEKGWTQFGLQTYYALLNCGFRMRVTAGTASGVHPVPLGYGRVYVHTGESFNYPSWIEHLNQGHSFVTQGPLMDLRFNGELPGTTWQDRPQGGSMRITGQIISPQRLASIEVIRNGVMIESIHSPVAEPSNSFAYSVNLPVAADQSCWLAVRCFAEADSPDQADKVSFAHTNPVFVDIDNQPVRPRKRDVEYFIERMRAEIVRNQGVLSEQAVDEFRQAKAVYERILQRAE